MVVVVWDTICVVDENFMICPELSVTSCRSSEIIILYIKVKILETSKERD